MKIFLQKIALLIAVLLASSPVYAYDCTVDGICYNINTSEKTATVTYYSSSYYQNNNYYKGEKLIQEKITYYNNVYPVTSIGGSAFSGCTGLTSVTIPNSVTSISPSAFSDCKGLTSVTIPNSVTSIGWKAFRDCTGLTSVTIGNSVTSIGESAFRNCTGLTSVTFNAEKCTTMGAYDYPAFGGCTKLSNVTIGEKVTTIPSYAFSGCTNLTTVTIPNSVTSIGDYAFSGCTGLTSVTIGNSVTTIGKEAFSDCTAMTKLITIAPTPPTCGSRALDDINKRTCELFVTKGSIELYKAADQWKEFSFISEYDGVDDITIDGNDTADTVYDVYNLQGVRVGNALRQAEMTDALPRGVYILVSPRGTRKVKI